MAVLTSAGITFGDATTQTTAATSPTTATVLAATAGAAFGAVGTYAALLNTANSETASGDTLGGGSLRHSTTYGFTGGGLQFTGSATGGSTVSGTWRRMGGGSVFQPGCSNFYGSGLWLRIS